MSDSNNWLSNVKKKKNVSKLMNNEMNVQIIHTWEIVWNKIKYAKKKKK